MRLVLPCFAYTPRHAAPRQPLAPSSRQALAVGLAAALLPLGAAPALADDTPSSPSTSTGSPFGAAPAAEPVSPFAADPAPVAKPARAGSAAPSRAARRVATSLAFRAPASAPNGRVRVGVRLRAEGHAVGSAYVRLERSTGSGWVYAGRLLTDANGVADGTVRVAGDARLRATYGGTRGRAPVVSAARTVRSGSALRMAASSGGAAVLREAARHVGAPYRYGAVGPRAFDCSGFTRFVYGRFGVSLPHNSGAQGRVTRAVSRSAARPGDLVVMPGHVGIYAGAGRMYDAPKAGSRVKLRAIWTSRYSVHRVL